MSETGDLIVTDFVFDIEDLDPAATSLFGGKATGLARMVRAGIPVPPAFAISTDAYRAFQSSGQKLPDGLAGQLEAAIARLGDKAGRPFGGDGREIDPLLVSVRSGAKISMPGMMDTILNLGHTATSATHAIARGASRAFVVDSFVRFWKMYLEIVHGLDGEEFLEHLQTARAAAEQEGGDLAALEAEIVAFATEQGEVVPVDPRAQLDEAIAAVFQSWNSPRAKAYREHQGIAHDLGTAVTIQCMAFGNAEGDSGSGVAFSRDPNTGEPVLYGEYLQGRQGEDIVAGTRTPVDLARDDQGHAELRDALDHHSKTLESLYKDAVDIEFTLESGRLYLLQVRPAKRTAAAAVRIAADLVNEGLIGPGEALGRVSADQLKRLLRPVFVPEQVEACKAVAVAVGSSPGHATGAAVLDSDRAAERAATGEPVILVRPTTSPLDIRGMLAANGILTARGGALSHAAVVSRALDRPCVVGCENLLVDEEMRSFVLGGKTFSEGDYISIDGATGQVYDCRIELSAPEDASESLENLLHRADTVAQSEVWTSGGGGSSVPGVAVVSLFDVALGERLLDDLIEGVTLIGQGKDANGRKLCETAEAIGKALLARHPDIVPLHVRLPQPGSTRARFLVPNWPELDQRLFLPMGNPVLNKAFLRGLDAACTKADRRLTVLLGGVTDFAEWFAFEEIAGPLATLSTGIVVQNPAGLEVADRIATAGGVVWTDFDEIVNASSGLPQRAYLSDATLVDYVEHGALSVNPRRKLRAFLEPLFGAAIRTEGFVGCLFSSDFEPELLQQLHRIGFRRFSVPASRRPLARLLLGQVPPQG
ncbi:pyruvate, phosphate dikinase [Endobacter medicaginis]|nr:pyruvate, phosphate dikinase [Endobacter medicaginis]